MKTLFSQLPPDLPAAIFVVLHVWPGGRSYLPDILQRVCQFPVNHAVDGEPVVGGRVYIAPPDLHLLLDGTRVVVVRGPRENRCRPAINPLFRSAASAYSRRVIGVILSGTMDDGAAGLWAVKQAGGIGVVQDPKDAAFSEMPQSAIDAVPVDHVVPLAEMPALLSRLCREKVKSEPARSVPRAVRLYDDSAKMKQMEMDIDEVGKRSVFSCPECNGALWDLLEGGQLSYRCHVGHAYSGRSLREEQDGVLEQSLWSALRALVESAALDERLADRAAEAKLPNAADAYRRNAEEKRVQESRIRDFLTALRPTPGSSEESAAG